jgi:hypothetical protein
MRFPTKSGLLISLHYDQGSLSPGSNDNINCSGDITGNTSFFCINRPLDTPYTSDTPSDGQYNRIISFSYIRNDLKRQLYMPTDNGSRKPIRNIFMIYDNSNHAQLLDISHIFCMYYGDGYTNLVNVPPAKPYNKNGLGCFQAPSNIDENLLVSGNNTQEIYTNFITGTKKYKQELFNEVINNGVTISQTGDLSLNGDPNISSWRDTSYFSKTNNLPILAYGIAMLSGDTWNDISNMYFQLHDSLQIK